MYKTYIFCLFTQFTTPRSDVCKVLVPYAKVWHFADLYSNRRPIASWTMTEISQTNNFSFNFSILRFRGNGSLLPAD